MLQKVKILFVTPDSLTRRISLNMSQRNSANRQCFIGINAWKLINSGAGILFFADIFSKHSRTAGLHTPAALFLKSLTKLNYFKNYVTSN